MSVLPDLRDRSPRPARIREMSERLASAHFSSDPRPSMGTRDSMGAESGVQSAVTAPKNTLAISNLMSPPDLGQPESMFAQVSGPRGKRPDSQDVQGQFPISPPFSPVDLTAAPGASTAPPAIDQDPILFPRVDSATIASTEPLFDHHRNTLPDEVIAACNAGVDAYMARNPAPQANREDYTLAAEVFFRSRMMSIYQENPQAHLAMCRRHLEEEAKARAGAMRTTKAVTTSRRLGRLAPKTTAGEPMLPKPAVSRPANGRVEKPKTKAVTARPLRETPAASRKAKRASPSQAEPHGKTSGPTKEDRDFDSVPDLCPPWGALKPTTLKIDWKGPPLDLTNDPNRHRLHPYEVELASTLRLDCATYLTTKRRIFVRRLDCALQPKEFRKTDAQKECNIDVNKASKLWEAFNHAGWLREEWMYKYMPEKKHLCN